MARPSGPKDKAGGRWTQARFNSFIKSLLRSGTRRWAPISDVKKRARTKRGFYMCACNKEIPASIKIDNKRVNNVIVDHINPIIDPEVGFVSWDDTINRMFCEEDNLQILCYECHTQKTQEERATAKERRERENNE